MRWSYDMCHDVLYVLLSEEPVASTRELPDRSVADLDDQGRLVGVEVLFGFQTWEWPALIEAFDLQEDDTQSIIQLATSSLFWGAAGRVPDKTVVLADGRTSSPAIELELTAV